MWGQIISGHTCPAAVRAPLRTVAPAASVQQPQSCGCKTQSAARPTGRSRIATAAAAGSAPAIRIPTAPESPPAYAAPVDKYAIVEIGGHQLFVEEGRWYTVNRLVATPGSKIQLRRVVGCKSEGQFACGQPFLENVVVEADVLEDLKGPKVHIFKYRAKKHYRKRTGHRQPLTKFLVTKIQA